MAQVLPAERGLRRVIGDGESVPDGEVDGLDESDFLALYRQLVLLRTYDERSLVYHRQGRIGTYAMFWNHEAMQVGSAYALERDDWIFPSYRESAIGLLRGMPPATVLSWWRGHPAGWWNPLDYNVASICVPIATHVPARGRARVGKEAPRRADGRARLLRRRRHLRRRIPRGRELRRGDAGAADPVLQQQPMGDLDAARRRRPPPRPSRTRRSGTGCRAYASTAPTSSRSTRRRATPSTRARAGDGPTFVEAVTYRTAPHGTADDPSAYIDQERVEEERRRECVGRFEGYLRRLGALDDETVARGEGGGARGDARGHRRRRGGAASRSGARLRVRVRRPAAASFGDELAELRRILDA